MGNILFVLLAIYLVFAGCWILREKKLKKKHEEQEGRYRKNIDYFQSKCAVLQKAIDQRPAVRYATIKTFNPSEENYIHNVANIGRSEEFVFFLYCLEMQAIAAAKGGNGEEQVRAIKWLEGFDLVRSEMARFVSESDKLSSSETESLENGEVSLS